MQNQAGGPWHRQRSGARDASGGQGSAGIFQRCGANARQREVDLPGLALPLEGRIRAGVRSANRILQSAVGRQVFPQMPPLGVELVWVDVDAGVTLDMLLDELLQDGRQPFAALP